MWRARGSGCRRLLERRGACERYAVAARARAHKELVPAALHPALRFGLSPAHPLAGDHLLKEAALWGTPALAGAPPRSATHWAADAVTTAHVVRRERAPNSGRGTIAGVLYYAETAARGYYTHRAKEKTKT